MQVTKKKFKSSFTANISLFLLVLSCSITLLIAVFIYIEIKFLFKESLREHVKAIASTGAMFFKTEELDKIRGRASLGTSQYRNLIFTLQKIKMQNPKLIFVDVYRKTENPVMFEYVGDADSILPDIPIDLNGDELINESDALAAPGDLYDGSEVPNFVENAFIRPDVDPELELSQWGLTLDASAPIFNKYGLSEYVFNVSLNVTEFVRHQQLALVPFQIFVIILILILCILTCSLLKIWSSRVNLLQDLDRQKDELLGIVAHQLAKPITAIRWDLESLLDGDLGALPEKQKDEVDIMRTQAVNLADLVSMILDVSRVQLGKIKLEAQPLDLNAFFKEIIDVIEPTVKQKKIHFVKNMPASMPTVLLDKRYTRMTIENLLTNAVKYTPEGGKVTLDVSFKDGTMHCEVSDTGCGIPKEDQGKIFGKMFRASNVRNAVEGNGFGLYVAKGAVEGQGGTIGFSSKEGAGTTFTVTLPVREATLKS